MADLENRRPLKSRQTGWAAKITTWLTTSGVTPNQISLASMVCALLAGLAFWVAGAIEANIPQTVAFILGALFCQMRLLCNLFDGMVAVEGGKSAPDGPFWNEFPDRVSDILIFVGLGLGVGFASLGWAAAALAVLTAYTRELGANIGLPPDFSGPMAKQHRMAVVTIVSVLASIMVHWGLEAPMVQGGLWIVCIGSLVTVFSRSIRIRKQLLSRK